MTEGIFRTMDEEDQDNHLNKFFTEDTYIPGEYVEHDWRFEDHHEFCRYPNTAKSHYCHHVTGHCDQCKLLKTRNHCPLKPITQQGQAEGS